jgi:hypothetical protein
MTEQRCSLNGSQEAEIETEKCQEAVIPFKSTLPMLRFLQPQHTSSEPFRDELIYGLTH